MAVPFLRTWKARARRLKAETYALYLAYRDPRVPWYARLVVVCVVGYALSPIDLIPDFIPVLGYVDDLFLVPMGIALAIRLIPSPVMEDCRRRAQDAVRGDLPVSRWVTVAIVAIWLALAGIAVVWLGRVLGFLA